jgi:hypothetical protein
MNNPARMVAAIHLLLAAGAVACGCSDAASDDGTDTTEPTDESEDALRRRKRPDASTTGSGTSTGSDAGAGGGGGGTAVDAGPKSAHQLYVATTGSDSNAGTQAAPFKTIQKASQVALADTTVHVAPGTYAGNVVTNTNGTAAGRIRYVSDVKWGAKIVGSGTESAWSNRGNYVDIVGFDVSGTGRLGILNWASFTLIAGNHVHDLKVSGGCTGNGGAGINDADYTKSDDDIIGNVVHDIGVPGACNGVQGIYHSNLRGRIVNNIVYRASSFGIHLWHAGNAVKIVNNTVFANGSSTMGGGIVIGAGDAPGGIVVDNTVIANNIVVHNPRGSITEYCYAGQACIGPNNKVVNNLVFANGNGISLRVGTHTGTITLDPQFVNYQANGSGNYHLLATSPAIDKASSTYAPSVDLDGAPRPYGAAADVGAYEWRP